jgi:PAS domain S-box-containing protein
MKPTIRALLVEDNPADAELVRLAMRRAGLKVEWKRVQTEPDFLRELQMPWDIVLSDFEMPQFNGMRALELLKQQPAPIPFILISGTIGEDIAVLAMKNGAADYLLKDRLVRLGPAIEHALQESQLERERQQAEAALRESTERYHALFENMRDAIFELTPDGSFLSMNSFSEKITGWTLGEWQGRGFYELVHPDDLPRVLAAFANIMQGEAPPVFELSIKRQDGQNVIIELTVCPRLRDGQITSILGIGRDVTERRKLEEQLRQSQKMEAIGQLAGGVAHDFNNILTVIQIHASELLTGSLEDEEIILAGQEIAEAADRAAALTRQLLIFSRKQVMQSAPADLNEVVTNIARMLHRILGEDIALQTNCGPRLPLTQVDVGMVEQVLLNLAVNSRDAMPGGGQLEITTQAGLISEEEADPAVGIKAGPYVSISIADNGSGIPPEIMPHIFEPFYTTKETGKGTGLGLATVYGIVNQHGGWIDVTSEIGVGTTFRICFPSITGEIKTPAKKRESARLVGGQETILLVEDEPHLRLIASNILERCGYTVLVASKGTEALQVWEECSDHIDLLFTDMVMPDGMTGRQLAQRLLSERPALKVVYNSGYSADVSGSDLALQEGVNFLQKPYDLHKLVQAVRNMLDQP